MIKILSRSQLDPAAWDACVAASPQRIVYGYSWYLDSVLSAPDWKWVGIVQADEVGQYQTVMPVPLRRKSIAGVSYEWVVHQPFFCQFLAVFSRNELADLQPFYALMTQQFRYGSVYCIRHPVIPPFLTDCVVQQTTHVLDLSVGYETLHQHYTRDRKLNLRRAGATNWKLLTSTDPEPLLTLFRDHHADAIDGSIADWAYAMFRNLFTELTKRGMARLRYAVCNGRIEAGALFVQEGNRIIYLFNAASAIGRRGNARTLLIDQLIREKAGQALIFDFESPIKPSICAFYQSFGAAEESFWSLRWNRLSPIERVVLTIKKKLM